MAAKKSSGASSAKKKSNNSSAKRAATPAEKSSRKKAAAEQQYAPAPIIDDAAKRNIAGIVCIVIAIALGVILAWPSDAIVTTFLSTALKRILGRGAVLLPVLAAILAVTFLVRFNRERVPARAAIGLGLIYLAVITLFALFTPVEVADGTDLSLLFVPETLEERGGYVGAAFAWIGLKAFGLPVGVIIAIGVIAIGLVIIGFSVRGLVESIQRERMRIAEREYARFDEMADEPRIMLARNGQDREAFSNAQTGVLPAYGENDDIFGQARLVGGRSSQRVDPEDNARTNSKALTRKLGKKNAPASGAKKPAVSESAATISLESTPRANDGFELPSMDLLKTSKTQRKTKAFENELANTAAHLQQTMEDFGIMATVVDWVAGPTVTLFEVDLPPGVRVSRLTALNDDIALALAAPGVRIFAPIAGTHFVGIEVPNATRENVLLGDVLREVKGGPLEMAIGKDVEGNPIICDLAKMPHLLIGGTTGSGKSVGINAMIMSMLMRATPSEVRFIMIDPKRVEFAPYDGIPHLYVPVVTEPKEAASALSWGVAEMERRLKLFSKVGVRNIGSYNEMVAAGKLEDESAEHLPYIVIVIDELADLMMNVGKEVEFSISRIAQLARAAGIHLIVATQRPSANVVTGLIKANITNRMAFNVASGLDSRVILDTSGAESLIGNGDLLLSKPEYAKPVRIQGCYTSDEEIQAVVDAVKAQGEPDYHSEILKTNLITLGDSMPDGSGGPGSSDDPLIWDAAEIVVASGLGSTSNIQRKLKVGYSRAGRIMDMLEEKGVVGPPNGSKPREVLVDAMELEALKAFELNDEVNPKE